MEVQFYLIAPLLLCAMLPLRRHGGRACAVVVCLLLSALSLTYQIVIASTDNVAFFSPISRLWQFLLGMLVGVGFFENNPVAASTDAGPCKLTSEEENAALLPSNQSTGSVQSAAVECGSTPSLCFRLLPVLSVFLPSAVVLFPLASIPPQQLLRLALTVSTAALIHLGGREQVMLGFKESKWTRPLAYLGDISYSVYLIHWPLIVFLKYRIDSQLLSPARRASSIPTNYDSTLNSESTALLLGTLAVSVAQYECIERRFNIRASRFYTNCFILAEVLVILALLHLPIAQLLGAGAPVHANSTAQSTSQAAKIPLAIAENQRIALECGSLPVGGCDPHDTKLPDISVLRRGNNPVLPVSKEPLFDDHWTNYCAMQRAGNGSGRHTALVLGNSYAHRQVLAVADALGGHFSKLYLFTRAVCTPFASLNDEPVFEQWHCNITNHLPLLMARELRPDFIFLTTRIDHLPACSSEIASIAEARRDQCVARMEQEVWEFERHARHVFIVEPHVVPAAMAKGVGVLDNVATVIARRLTQGQSIEDLYLPNQVPLHSLLVGCNECEVMCPRVQEVSQRLHKSRVRFSSIHCTNCTFVPVQELFCDESRCNLYDPATMFSYYCDGHHLSEYGARKVTPMLRREIERVREELFDEIED